MLAVLLLLLLLVFLVLFSPINYRVEGEKKNAPGGLFRVSWLLGAIRCRGSYDADNGLKIRLKVLWLTLPGGEPKEKKTKKLKSGSRTPHGRKPLPPTRSPLAYHLLGQERKPCWKANRNFKAHRNPYRKARQNRNRLRRRTWSGVRQKRCGV